MNKVIGQYNALGYCVVEIYDNGYSSTLYHAGNSLLDSCWYVPVTDRFAASLTKIREMCIESAKEIAEEQGALYCGIEFDESDTAPV